MNPLVCMLTTVHAPFDTRVFHKEAKTLSSAGYDVTLIAQHNCEEVVDGIRIAPLPKPRSRFDRMTRLTTKALVLALRQNAAVYHFHDPELIPVGLILRLCKKRVVYDVHENVPNDVGDKEWIPKVCRRIVCRFVDLLERWASQYFSAVVTAEEEISDRFRGKQGRVRTICNYPILEEFSPDFGNRRLPSSTGCIANFGGVFPERCIQPVVKAMGLLPDDLKCRLVLCGACESEALLKEISNMPEWQYVEYKGLVDRKNMLLLLSKTFVAVVLYSRQPRHDGTRSNRLYEAMAAGLPVITSDATNWKAFIGWTKCGLAVDPDDPQAIAQAILYLRTHADEAASMGSRGREIVFERFNWTTEAPKFLRLYGELLNGVHSAQVTGGKGNKDSARHLETLPPSLSEAREERINESRDARSLRDPLKG